MDNDLNVFLIGWSSVSYPFQTNGCGRWYTWGAKMALSDKYLSVFHITEWKSLM